MFLWLIKKIMPAKCRMLLVESAKNCLFWVPLFGITCGVLIIPCSRRHAKVIGMWHSRFISLNTFFDFDAVAFFNEVFRECVYEREYSVQQGDIVVDIGAHVGMFTLKSSERARLVISFEPVEDNLRLLRKNIQGKDNVIIIPKALGKSRGLVRFLQTKRSGTGQFAYLKKLPDNAVIAIREVEVDTLDDCIKNLGLCEVNLLKIDAEGAEVDILKGAEETLKITKHIAMELHYQGEANEVADFLKRKSFEVYVIGNMLYAKKIMT